MNRKTHELTVTSKTPNVSFSGEKIEEERDYVNTAAFTVDKMCKDKKSPSFTRSFLPIAVCWVILLVIMALRIYFTTVISAKLTENQQLVKTLKDNETTENLQRDNDNLTVIIGNLRQKYNVLESKITDLTEENNKLNKSNQDLETQKNKLTEQKRKLNENSIAQLQQNIDAYCPKDNKNERQCKSCEEDWLHKQSSCYAINNAEPAKQKTWEEARDDCRGENSDLAVIVNGDEKRFIKENSYGTSGVNGYWIGLRVEDGRWKWIDGSDVTESSWIQQKPPINGQCAISVQNEGWKSVKCGDKNAWICKRKALSV